MNSDAKLKRKVSLRKVSPADSRGEIEKVWEFCKLLDEPKTNGFGWPEGLMRATTFEECQLELDKLEKKGRIDVAKIQDGRVPQEYWWIYDEADSIVGLAKIRLILTPIMWKNGGHIGLGIAAGFRGKGYGTAALAEALEYCHSRGLDDVLLTVHADNLPSRRMMEKNGGKMLDIIRREGEDVDVVRYLISRDDL